MATMTTPTSHTSRLHADRISIGYGDRPVSQDLSVAVPEDSFTVVIGPNACGKSTLLRALARLLRPTAGSVVLDGKDIHRLPPKTVAQRLGLLPQSSLAPDGISVIDLVARGRFPHQRLLQQWTPEDRRAVHEALEQTSTSHLSARPVAELSGGQRQRVWIAMVLAQQTPLLLLDEPTTFLDIAHQVGVLDLCRQLHHQGRTVVAVLHDLNQAARYATHLIAMKDGVVVSTGSPEEVVTEELVREVFGLACVVVPDPVTGTPMVVPCADDADLTGARHHGAREDVAVPQAS
ncbi:ABC transporter ATP-binding protein [Parenemella sanctibonifatiensis]|nr:ABC transporter ATP-binding protein [Parenemella sanctibonifatiensis]